MGAVRAAALDAEIEIAISSRSMLALPYEPDAVLGLLKRFFPGDTARATNRRRASSLSNT